jgi:hypothetical protein
MPRLPHFDLIASDERRWQNFVEPLRQQRKNLSVNNGPLPQMTVEDFL